MKLFAAFIFLISVPALSQIKGVSWENIKTSGKGDLVIIYYEQPGLIQKVNGQMKGMCVDILADFKNFVKTKYGKDISINYASNQKEFALFLSLVQSTPNVLGVTNTSITAERKKVMKFTPPFMSTPLVLLTHEAVPSIDHLQEISKAFQGFTAEVITGSTHVKIAEDIKKTYSPSLVIKKVGSSETVLKDLAANQKVFSILDFTEYVSVVRRQLPIKRHDVDLGGAQDLGFVMSKDSDWDGVWNEFLTQEYRKSVGYKKIVSENLGATFINLVR